MKNRRLGIVGALAILLSFAAVRAAPAPPPRYEPNWASLDQRPCPTWYLDAKFGIFIHWGVYSVPAWGVKQAKNPYAEWYWFRISDPAPDNPWRKFHEANYGKGFPYQDFAPRFRAELFDANRWADLFARSGAKYIVPTSKHHEGFALWPSAEASRTWGRPWNSAEIGPRRDLIGELAEATRARGLKFGVYYSLYEWYNPLWLTDRKRYVDEHMIPQFKDLVTRYHPSVIFSDGEWDLPARDWKSEQLLAWLFNDSPSRADVAVDDRWGSDTVHRHGSYYTTEYAAGMADGAHPWEESRGLGTSYGLNRAEDLGDYRSARELVLILADTVSRGGNLLLDIGPAADGTIPVIMQERLVEIGDWLKVNGEAIYGTRFAGRPCQWSAGRRPEQKLGKYRVKYDLMDQVGQAPRGGQAVKQVFFTKKPGALYAITAGWPGPELVLRDLSVPADSVVTLLGRGGELGHSYRDGVLTIRLPALGPEEAPGRYAYSFRITGAELLPEKPAPPSR